METGASEVRTFYRIVKSDPPTLTDFVSPKARGRQPPPRLPPELLRLWDGLSVYATLAQARRKARQNPMIGPFIAEPRVTPDRPIRVERTTREAGHHTLWGAPHALLACVAAVVLARVTGEGEHGS